MSVFLQAFGLIAPHLITFGVACGDGAVLTGDEARECIEVQVPNDPEELKSIGFQADKGIQ